MKLAMAKKIHFETGPNMTPLVDIVMVILIFLMLTGTFATAEWFLQSNIPLTKKGAGNVAQPANVHLDEPLEIRVDSFTRPDANGVPVEMWAATVGQFMIQNSREQLQQQLVNMREQFARNNTPTSKIQVVISPRGITKYKHLVDAYGAALEAKYEKIAFSTARQ